MQMKAEGVGEEGGGGGGAGAAVGVAHGKIGGIQFSA
jgi:hypothetical protein